MTTLLQERAVVSLVRVVSVLQGSLSSGRGSG